MTTVAELPLVGAGGEPVDFARTIVSHRVAELMPNRVDLQGRTLETTLPVPGGASTVHVTEAKDPPVRRTSRARGRPGAVPSGNG